LGYGIQAYGISPYGGQASPTTFIYDEVNRLSAVRNPVGSDTVFRFDGAGNRTAIWQGILGYGYQAYGTSPYGGQTGFVSYFYYDSLNRLVTMRDAMSECTYFFYDEVSNRAKVIDPRGNATYFGYDNLDKLVRIQDALGRNLYFEYDAVSNASRVVDSEGASSTNTYDSLNRRTQTIYSAAGSIVSESLAGAPYYVYDEKCNVTQIGDLWGLHRVGYDVVDRPCVRQYPNASVVYFEYDANANVSTLVYPGTSGKAFADYDAIGHQGFIQSPSGARFYITYDEWSNPTQLLLGNSARRNIAYDFAEQVTRWTYADRNRASLTYFDYVREGRGLISKAVREATHTVYYSYDANGRLASELWAKTGATPSEVYGYRYEYDGASNRTKARINGSDAYYFYDTANQLTVTGTTSAYATPTYYLYDRNGSVTHVIPFGAPATYFAYNAAGLVARIGWQDASSTYFFYDGSLQRFAMVPAGQSAANYFLWDGPNLLQELNVDGTVKEEHTHGISPIAGIGQLVETNRPGQTPQIIYPVMDPRGTITKWLQSDGVTIVASREYDAFGRIIPNSSVGTWPGRFGYQGQSWLEIFSGDGSQRLLLSPTRLYDPDTGRFFQNDQYLLNRTVKHYTYCSQNPANLFDPLGLDDQSESVGRIIRNISYQYGPGGTQLLANFCRRGGKINFEDLWFTDLLGRRSKRSGMSITLDSDSEGAAAEQLFRELMEWQRTTDFAEFADVTMMMGIEPSDVNRMIASMVIQQAQMIAMLGLNAALIAIGFVAPITAALLGGIEAADSIRKQWNEGNRAEAIAAAVWALAPIALWAGFMGVGAILNRFTSPANKALNWYGSAEAVIARTRARTFEVGAPGAGGKFWTTSLPSNKLGPGAWKIGGNLDLTAKPPFLANKGGFNATYVLSSQESKLFNRAWGTNFSWNPTSWWKGAFGQYYYAPNAPTALQRFSEAGRFVGSMYAMEGLYYFAFLRR
jgi:RHS repeat-associated protein